MNGASLAKLKCNKKEAAVLQVSPISSVFYSNYSNIKWETNILLIQAHFYKDIVSENPPYSEKKNTEIHSIYSLFLELV